MSRSLLYADVPAFYAEVERVRDATLAERPVIVGGDPRKKGLVQAATPDAIAAGVRIGMAVLDALERCPHGRALRTDMARYRDADKRLRAVFARYAERIEPAGLGAAYLAGSAEPAKSETLAASLRAAVAQELRLPLRVGAGPVKFLAQLAAEDAGVDGFRAIDHEELRRFLDPLPVSRLPGVGPNTAARLAELGIRTAGELVAAGRERIEQALGNHGLAVLAAAMGQGDDRIRAAAHPQSLWQEVTLGEDTVDRGQLVAPLRGLAERLERALALEGLAARRLALKVRYADGERTTRTVSVDRGLATASDLLGVALALLDRTQAGVRPLRLLGLGASALARPQQHERQLGLFDERP
jgi:DNA polymerase IV